MAETIIVELGTKHFQEANAAVRAALAAWGSTRRNWKSSA